MTVLLLAAVDAPSPLAAGAVAAIVAMAQVRGARSQRRLADARVEHMARQAVRTREELLANTAHELRTPLTAVTTALELLRDGYAASPEDVGMFLDQATVASRHMAFLINDVVDLAALEAGRLSLHVREQRVQELLFDATQVMQLTAQSRGVGLSIAEAPDELAVQADRGRFLQVAFNLIGNAIKFSEAGSSVQVTVVVDGPMVRFEVQDTGPGVEPEQRERLFTRFGRAHDRSKPAIAGTGLGLHVCKLLVETMRGRIGFRPGDPRGSVFWFELPLTVARAPQREVAQLERTPA